MVVLTLLLVGGLLRGACLSPGLGVLRSSSVPADVPCLSDPSAACWCTSSIRDCECAPPLFCRLQNISASSPDSGSGEGESCRRHELHSYSAPSRGTWYSLRDCCFAGTRRAWKLAARIGREASLHSLGRVSSGWCADRETLGSAVSSKENDAAASRLLTSADGGYDSLGDVPSQGENVVGVDSEGRPRLPRGAHCHGPLGEIAVPPPGFVPRIASSTSPEVFCFCQRISTHMLRSASEVDWLQYS